MRQFLTVACALFLIIAFQDCGQASHDASFGSMCTDSSGPGGVVTNPPPAPTNVNALTKSTTEVDISWTDSSSGNDAATIYTLERTTVVNGSPGSYGAIATLNAGTTQYDDTGLMPSTSYSYIVISTNIIGSSVPSPNAVAYTGTPPSAPATPANVMASVTTATSITVTWSESGSEPVSNFDLEKSLDGTNFTTVATIPGGTSSYTDINLHGTTKYYYEIRAGNSVGYSSFSSIVSATTPSAVSFASDVLPILQNNCTSCHEIGQSGFGSALSIDLSSFANIMKSSNMCLGVVVPGNAATSLLYTQVESGNMPFGQGPLTASQVRTIQDWINQGAADN